jgi:hypothetical protein
MKAFRYEIYAKEVRKHLGKGLQQAQSYAMYAVCACG